MAGYLPAGTGRVRTRRKLPPDVLSIPHSKGSRYPMRRSTLPVAQRVPCAQCVSSVHLARRRRLHMPLQNCPYMPERQYTPTASTKPHQRKPTPPIAAPGTTYTKASLHAQACRDPTRPKKQFASAAYRRGPLCNRNSIPRFAASPAHARKKLPICAQGMPRPMRV